MACAGPEHCHLFPSDQKVVGINLVVPWVLMPPLAALLGLDGLHIRVAGGPVHLFLCCAFLCQRVSSLVARRVAVGGNPLHGDRMASAKGGKSSRQVVVFSVPIWLKGMMVGQGFRTEKISAGFNVGWCCFRGFCFSFVVWGVQAGSEADFIFSASWVLYADSCPSIPNCVLSRAVGVYMSPGLFWVLGFRIFLGEGLSLGAALGVFLTNTSDGTPNDGRSSLTPGRNGNARGDLFVVMIKHALSSFKCSALVNDTSPPLPPPPAPFQSPFCWLRQSLPHRVVLQPLEFGSLAKQFVIPAIIKWLELCDCFWLHYWRWLHDTCDDAGCLVLYFVTRSKSDLAVVPHAVIPYSSTGLTPPVCSLLGVTVSVPHVVPASFFMRASRTLALASAFSVRCFRVSLLSKVTTR